MIKRKKTESKKDTYEPTDEETETLNEFKEKKEFANAWQNSLYEKFLRFYYLYRGLQEEEEYPWRNNLCLPIAFSIIETLTPRILLNQPKITLKGLVDESKAHTKQSKAILDYDYFNGDFQLELIDWFKRFLIYGTSVVKVMFKKVEIPVPEKKIISKIKRFFRRKSKGRIEQYVDIKALEPFHFKIDDPQSNYIKNADWVMNDVYLTEREVKDNREGIYKNTEYVKAEEIRDDFASAKWEVSQLSNKKRGRILNEGITSIGSSQSFKRQKLVKITEWYQKRSKEYPLGRLVVIANDKIILRDDINPYWYVEGEFPFVEIKDNVVPGEFYSIGEIESVESLIYEKNHIRNRRLDSSEQSADEMWWVDPESDIDENELVWRPSGIVNGVYGKDFGVIERGQPFVTMSNEEKLVEQDIQNTIGYGDATRGISQKYETATGLMALINEANQRFAGKIKNIGDMGIARLCKMILQMEQFEASGDRIGRITGKDEFIKVPAEEISSDYFIKVAIDPNPLLNRTLNIETLNKVLQTLSVSPESKAFELIQEEIIKELNILDEEQIKTVMGRKSEVVGTLPGRMAKRSLPSSSARAEASVIGGAETARTAQPTRPPIEAPAATSIPKRMKKR